MPPVDAANFLRMAVETFGESWSYQISRRLNINPRTLERWGAGKREIPPEVIAVLTAFYLTKHFWQKQGQA